MDPNVDEDLIEATIRRIAEAQAGRAASPEDVTPAPEAAAPEPEAEDAAGPPDLSGAEAPVEEAPPVDKPEADEARVPASVDESAIEETIRRVAAARAEREADPVEPAAPAGDESAIEETIRRVAAARAEREAEPEAAAGETGSPAFEDQPRSAAAVADFRPFAGDSPLTIVPRGRPLAAAAIRADIDAGDAPWADAIERIEHTLAEIHAMLASLVDRAPVIAAPARPGPQHRADDWEDEAPPVQRMAFTPPVRPAVFRDVTPAPAPAPAPAMAPAGVDERPRPEPPPPVRPESRRGFDLLPRTYRITVEDKRRGVDLVPLHRALLAMDGVRDMSLLSYNNGVAIVSLEMVNDIDTQALGKAVSRAMSREAAVEQHNERTLVVKLAED